SMTVNSGATLQGGGSISGIVTIATGAMIAPGINSGIGTLTLGALNLSSSASTAIQLGGTATTQFDQIHVTGQATLGGSLSLSLASGFTPVAGNSFDIFNWGTQAGAFSNVNLPTMNGRIAWDSSQLYTTGTLSVTATYFAGDFNRDGHINAADIFAMEQALA